jgi:predicted ATP-grasp superfamily ATP-dependent carboligase
MTSPRRPVLVLDGQTVQALACVRSLGRAGYPVLVASPRRWPLAAWSRFCLASYRLSGETPRAFASLRDWAAARDACVVLPLTERACVLVNLGRTDWEAAGMRIGCPPQAMLDQAFDKVRTLDGARACGVVAPPTCVPSSWPQVRAAAAQLRFPCVVKSRFSNAWDGSRFVADPGPGYAETADELETAVRARQQAAQWPIIQGFVPGRGKGVFALFDHGRAVAWFAHERLRDVRPSGSGSSLRRSAALDERLRAPADRLLTYLGWHGPAMVEFRDDGAHDPYLIEVNGRFWGSLELAIASGADFPRWWVEVVLGNSAPAPTTYRLGVTRRWLWGDIKRFLYILAGPPRGYPGRFPTRWQGMKELLGRQPQGTRVETWSSDDRWPALGEWVQGLSELAGEAITHLTASRTARSGHESGLPAPPELGSPSPEVLRTPRS